MSTLEPRRAPLVSMTDIVFPEDTNQYGTMFGGGVMAMMDKAAFLASVRFARCAFVTISSDGIQFLAPIRQGDLVEVAARVAFAGNTSLVVKVEVWREPAFEGCSEICTEGWFAMAARDQDNKPVQLPPLRLEGEGDEQLAARAKEFRDRSIRGQDESPRLARGD